jgi:hypothetical protein
MKNIDKIFNESLQNYERQPRTEAWEKLQARLEKKGRKILPLWWKYASAASVALLLGVGGYWFVNKDTNSAEQVAIIKKPVVEKNESSIIPKEDTIELSTNISSDNNNHSQKERKTNFKKEYNTHSEFVINKESQIVEKKIEYLTEKPEVAQIERNPIVEPKKTEETTIVLVLENTKPKVEEETIVLNFVETMPEVIAQNTEPEKKQSRVGKIWEQLKRAKNGENVNWNEVGVKPQKVLARADAKIENVLSKGEMEK